jgi:hypothetical protein
MPIPISMGLELILTTQLQARTIILEEMPLLQAELGELRMWQQNITSMIKISPRLREMLRENTSMS